jgi:hypothetical protein
MMQVQGQVPQQMAGQQGQQGQQGRNQGQFRGQNNY